MSHMNGGTCTLYKTSLLNYTPKISDRYNLHVVANRWKSKKKKNHTTLSYIIYLFGSIDEMSGGKSTFGSGILIDQYLR